MQARRGTSGTVRRPPAAGLAAVAISGGGVAAVLLGDERRELGRKLVGALPGAELVEDDAVIAPALEAVARHLDAPVSEWDFALDLRGEPGEHAVWTALRAIPVGDTRSYDALAPEIGSGMTAQEVGAACGANRLAIAVPCHRVLEAVRFRRWDIRA